MPINRGPASGQPRMRFMPRAAFSRMAQEPAAFGSAAGEWCLACGQPECALPVGSEERRIASEAVNKPRSKRPPAPAVTQQPQKRPKGWWLWSCSCPNYLLCECGPSRSHREASSSSSSSPSASHPPSNSFEYGRYESSTGECFAVDPVEEWALSNL